MKCCSSQLDWVNWDMTIQITFTMLFICQWSNMEWLLHLVTAAPLERGPHGRKNVFFSIQSVLHKLYMQFQMNIRNYINWILLTVVKWASNHNNNTKKQKCFSGAHEPEPHYGLHCYTKKVVNKDVIQKCHWLVVQLAFHSYNDSKIAKCFNCTSCACYYCVKLKIITMTKYA